MYYGLALWLNCFQGYQPKSWYTLLCGSFFNCSLLLIFRNNERVWRLKIIFKQRKNKINKQGAFIEKAKIENRVFSNKKVNGFEFICQKSLQWFETKTFSSLKGFRFAQAHTQLVTCKNIFCFVIIETFLRIKERHYIFCPWYFFLPNCPISCWHV
jgi:hypothetical protein